MATASTTIRIRTPACMTHSAAIQLNKQPCTHLCILSLPRPKQLLQHRHLAAVLRAAGVEERAPCCQAAQAVCILTQHHLRLGHCILKLWSKQQGMSVSANRLYR